MSRRCCITGKRPLVGNRVSHAKNRTKMRQLPNLQRKRIWLTEEGRWVRLRVTARGLRTIEKKGLRAAMRDAGVTS